MRKSMSRNINAAHALYMSDDLVVKVYYGFSSTNSWPKARVSTAAFFAFEDIGTFTAIPWDCRGSIVRAMIPSLGEIKKILQQSHTIDI